MPLTISAFKDVASAFKSHKEEANHETECCCDFLSTKEIAELKLKYSFLDEDIFHQVLVVRKRHRVHVEDMLADLVAFREANEWPLRINENDLHSRVSATSAHTVGKTDDNMPLIYMKLKEIDVHVASAKEYQLQGQYAIQEASKLHAHGEVAVTLDFEGTSFGILTKLSSQDLSRGLDIFCKYPVKVKRVYVVNDSAIIRFIVKAVLSLASKRVRSKVMFS